MKKPRYTISRFNNSSFQVVDQKENCEVCVVNSFEEHEDAEKRAEKIADALNKHLYNKIRTHKKRDTQ